MNETMAIMKKLKYNDLFILKNSVNGYKQFEGKVMRVTTTGPISTSFNARSVDGLPCNSNIGIFSGDTISLATRKEQAEFTKERIDELKKDIKRYEEEYKSLTKFETDEDEVADKLDKIMKASKTGGAKKIAELLKLMKKSDYL